jgi:kynurenine 3-monooxygenase
MTKEKIHIVGSGLVGPLAAIYCARRGYDVELYERRSDMRKTGIAGGRSINLAVSARGLKALESVGLREKVMSIAIPMGGRMVHDGAGQTSYVPYGQKEDEVINAMSRGLLNIFVLEEAEKYDNININFDHTCTGYDIDKRQLQFGDKTIQADTVIGADGAWSALRKTMLDHVANFNYAQNFLEYGYKELVIPPGPDGSFCMEKNALHIWPRQSYMLIALPNTDGSFTCTLFFPYEGPDSFASLKNTADVTAFFQRVFPDALAMMPTLADDFFANPTGALTTIRCAPWHVGGQLLLIGDASHAIVPFYGQGLNCGFEDCRILGELMDAHGDNWASVFVAFSKQRKPDADAIADMALDNFIEMRDSVTNPRFLLKKKIGFELEKRFPGQFIPRYSMVTFHPEISYAEAQRLGAIHDRLLDELSANINDPAQVDWDRAGKMLKDAAL